MTEEQVFLAALDLPHGADRAAYLDEVCGQNSELRRQVEELLAAHERSGQFLDEPAAEQMAAGPQSPIAQTVALNAEGDDAMADNKKTNASPSDDGADDLQFLSPSTRPDSLGRLGHYEMLQVLGRGGFGIVFRAFDDILQRVVAIKVMAPMLAATSPARRRFLREAQSSAKVRHEHVVQVYEVGEQPLPYLAMEFIPGETLQQKLDRTGPLDVSEVLRIGRQVAEGLAAAHACDLIHRDIKPGNVLLEGGSHKAKITDFGLARAADDASISQSGIIAGTPMFMSPEQALGHHIDQRADLFSLGSVLYQMASGRPPFRAPSALAVLKRVAEEPPRPIPEIIPETPAWLCGIIAKLHAKNPADRFQSAREVADLLADCEAKLKAKQEVKNVLPGAAKPAGRKWVAAAAILLLPVIALAVTEFAGVTHFLQKQQPTVAVIPKVDPEVTPKIDPKAEPKSPLVTGRFALAFDGETSLVRIPSLKITENHPLTVEAWAVLEQPNGQPKSQDLVANAALGGFALTVPSGYGGDGRRLGFGIRLKNPDTYEFAWEKQPVPRHQLIHVAGIYDGQSEIRFYVNGKLQSRTPVQGIKPSPRSLSLGGHPGVGSHLLGRMNEVRISKVARYEADFTPAKRWEPDADALAFYHFDEGEGTVLKDSSGNGHHGQIIGATWVKADGSPIAPRPATQTPPTYTNSIGMKFVIVPKGKSWLGGSKDKLGDKEVVIPADFYLGKYEVTQEEWEKVMGKHTSFFSRNGGARDRVKDILDAELKRFPVEDVSWDQCQVFAAKLNQREKETGWVYRLPTEAEWEYACRGGPMADKADSAFDFYLASPTNALFHPEQANATRYGDGTPKGLGRTCKVGSYAPNVLGLYDMHGNVWEWCEDTVKAADGVSHRPARGGSYPNPSMDCRAAKRMTELPSLYTNALGLRLARVPSGAPSPEAKLPLSAVGPFTDADVKRIAFLPAAEQVEEVRKELMRRNPGYDGKFEHKIEGGVVTEFRIVTDQVTDIAPIRVWSALRVLDCRGGFTDHKPTGLLADLTPLEGMNLAGVTRLNLARTQMRDKGLAHFKDCKNLTHLELQFTPVSDAGLVHFQDCKALVTLNLGATKVSDVGLAHFMDCKSLTYLNLGATKVTDAALIYFKDCKTLNVLDLGRTKVSDAGLVHIKGMPLKRLLIYNTAITDLTPLQGMPLEEIRLTPKRIIRGLDILREMKSLKTIGIGIEMGKSWPAAEFWDRHDKGEFGKAADNSPDRRAAEYVLSIGGTVKVNDQAQEIMAAANLPGESFRLTYASFRENNQVSDVGLAVFKNCKNLTYIDLYRTQVSDAGLANFKDCKNLTYLDLWETKVTGEGLVHFKDCKSLGGLGLSGTQVNDAGLAHFKDCNNLTVVHLAGTQVSDGGLAHFKDRKNLTKLFLDSTQVTDAGLADLAGLDKLTELNLANTKVTAKGVEGLAKALPKCKIKWDGGVIAPTASVDADRRAAEYVLSIGGTVRIDGATRDIRKVAELPQGAFQLTVVLLIKNKLVTDAGLAAFAGCTNVTDLRLYHCTQLTDAGLAYFKDWKGLTILRLEGVPVTDAGLANFEHYKDLQDLQLGNTQVTDAGLAHLAACKNLKSFQLLNRPVTDAGLAHLKDCKDLTHLDLRSTRVTDAGLANFKDCKDLTTLWLGGTPITDTGLAVFKDCKDMKDLDLAGTSVTDDALALVKGYKNLQVLRLTPKNFTTGLEIVRNMTSLKKIGTGHNTTWPAAEFWERYDKGEFK